MSHKASATVQPFLCKHPPIQGTRLAQILPEARTIFRALEKRTKRRPYVRSPYFHGDKILFDYFWQHMQSKSVPDRARRLRLLPCTLELLGSSRQEPTVFIDIAAPKKIRYKFRGVTSQKQGFAVLVEQDQRKGTKQLLTCYPETIL